VLCGTAPASVPRESGVVAVRRADGRREGRVGACGGGRWRGDGSGVGGEAGLGCHIWGFKRGGGATARSQLRANEARRLLRRRSMDLA